MNWPYYSRTYENWAPMLGRILVAGAFLFGAYGKFPGTESFQMSVGYTAQYGVPFPNVAVFLAFILEVVVGISLLVGFRARAAAFVLMLYTILLTLIFHLSFADQIAAGFFISHLTLIAGLLYISVYGAQYGAIKKSELPRKLYRTQN